MDNQSKLSEWIGNLEQINYQRSTELESRLKGLEVTIMSFESNSSKINSMTELIDTKMKEIHDANRRYETMFRNVTKEIAIIKSTGSVPGIQTAEGPGRPELKKCLSSTNRSGNGVPKHQRCSPVRPKLS